MNSNLSGSVISAQFEDALSNFSKSFEKEEIGVVTSVGDGIAIVYGLKNAFYNELVEFEPNENEKDCAHAENKVEGLVMFLGDDVKVLILGDDRLVKSNYIVKRKKTVIKVSVGQSLLGRVVSARGEPIDDKGPIESKEYKAIETKAPGVVHRKSVHEPMYTGYKVIDSLIPIGRGQRQLIIGDRFTGKTALCIDTILNQKQIHEDPNAKEEDKLYCVYVAIGKKRSDVAKIMALLEREGAMKYTTIVAATASDPAVFQYLAPYAGCTIGEYFRDNGKHALIIYDDLSAHAVSYRQISLLLRLPPGREAYPGDVFYLHSRLLERAAKLSDDLGAGSLTALPIIETQANDVSAYIPTNVISMTDGQIFLEAELFNKGIIPGVNVGLSVSRVGSAAQVKATKQVAGTVKLDLAQYREKEAFAKFGSSDLDIGTQRLLLRGALLTSVLKQEQFKPIDFANQALILYIATSGLLDDLFKSTPNAMSKFEEEFLRHFNSENKSIIEDIKKSKALSDDTKKAISKSAIDFLKVFSA